jgi:predicted acyltransferase
LDEDEPTELVTTIATEWQPGGTASSVRPVALHRIGSVDAYRGLVMLLMLAEVLRTCTVSPLVPLASLFAFVCAEQSHAAWVGMSLHDLIQPSFYFLVGLAFVLSRQRRRASGESRARLAQHTLLRSLILIFLGMALQAAKPRQWDWYFLDTLTQIGLAYPFLAVLAGRRPAVRLAAIVAILVGYWAWFALTPVPAAAPDPLAAFLSPAWVRDHGLSGFGSHWQKNQNVAWAFDLWFVNLFPRNVPHWGYVTGLTTLNFVPSIATMLLGSSAGYRLLRTQKGQPVVRPLAVRGVVLAGAGALLGVTGLCPIVKAIWTPSWVLVSGGCCYLLLACFHLLADELHWRHALFPLSVVGMNSLAAYILSFVFPAYAFNSIHRIVGFRPFEVFGSGYEPFVYGLLILSLYWLALYAMYRQRVFLRI